VINVKNVKKKAAIISGKDSKILEDLGCPSYGLLFGK